MAMSIFVDRYSSFAGQVVESHVHQELVRYLLYGVVTDSITDPTDLSTLSEY
jgi:hypothetical protein